MISYLKRVAVSDPNLSGVPDAATELRPESSTIMNEQINNVIDKLVSQINALEL